jgi:DNA-binding IclR family transcriptional regulator
MVVLSAQRGIVQRTTRVATDLATLRIVPAVDRAARLLGILDAESRPMTISEMARALGINKGTARDLLETLRAHGLLQRDEIRKTYRLGPRLARLGMAALGQLDLSSVAHPFLAELAEQVSGSVLLVVPHGSRATIVDKMDGSRAAMQVSATVGGRIRVAAGACGKVFLAHLSTPDVETALADLTHTTPNTLLDPEAYRRELEQVRRQGYATDDEEYLTGVRATSAPVFDARGQLVGAVLVVGLTGSLPLEDLPETGQRTVASARAISAALGATEKVLSPESSAPP